MTSITSNDSDILEPKTEVKKMFIRRDKRQFEDATEFKLIYFEEGDVNYRHFSSSQSLAQYNDRRSNDLSYMEIGRLALINETWEPYAIIGKKSITLSDLSIVYQHLDECLKYSKL